MIRGCPWLLPLYCAPGYSRNFSYGLTSRLERLISPYTIDIEFKTDLDLSVFLPDLQLISIEKVTGRGLTRLSALLVLSLFCAPLFVGLGRIDFRNDEPIYAFAVDLILKTGDWLTPRAIPLEDAAFLEKPPLKFWIVAGAIRAGVLPHNQFGHRFWDAAFGAAAFLYVFVIGVRLGGPLCGLVAVWTLFVHGPLLFDHGLRSNNMEAALLLCYCGGIYHAHAWSEARAQLKRRLHPQAVAAFFVLGFMTKFVAAIFLPFIFIITTLSFSHSRRRLLEDWRIWATAALLVVAATAPWFIYQTNLHGRVFWRVLLAEHVYARMVTFLDPAHVQPWHFYLSRLYFEVVHNGTFLPIVIGTLVVAVQTVRRRWYLGALILWWFIVPFAAISLGSSKLYHYVYPFLPPLALGAGYLPAVLLNRDSRVRRVLEDAGDRLALSEWVRRTRDRFPWLRRFATAIAVVAFGVALVTLTMGRFGIHIGDVTVFRNASIARPLTIGIILLLVGSWGRLAGRLVLALVLLMTLPIDAYRSTIERLDDGDDTVQVLARCLTAEMPPRERPGVYVHAEDAGPWRYAYYFHNIGWHHPPERSDSLLLPRLFAAGQQQPVLLTASDVTRVQRSLAAGALDAASSAEGGGADLSRRFEQIARVRFNDGLQLLLPGRYAACAGPRSEGLPAR